VEFGVVIASHFILKYVAHFSIDFMAKTIIFESTIYAPRKFCHVYFAVQF
jgi:hypothetical protein